MNCKVQNNVSAQSCQNLDCLQRVIKHFEMSSKSKEKLDEAQAILEMNQLKLLWWCETRMAHFVTTGKQFTKLLPAVYNCLYSKDIKKEEWNVHYGNTRGKLFLNSNEHEMYSYRNVAPEESMQNI